MAEEIETGAFAGCLMITKEWSDWCNGDYWWLQSVYVVPAFRRRGIFFAMVDAVRQRGRAAGNVARLSLYVERTNETAKRTVRTNLFTVTLLTILICLFFVYV